ncbi:tyrosine-protein phosphatase [Bifidobacterium dolichotidis]|nr:tyrosine-protein phosphatase [Bifidobacterium dolichotidis]
MKFSNQHSDASDQFAGINHAQYREVSKKLELTSIKNCRDLGGITTTDGHIVKSGMLLRSANLHHASDEDLVTLKTIGVQNIIDLRTRQEREAERDRLLSTWDLYEIPGFTERRELIAQLRGVIFKPGSFICSLYEQLLNSEESQTCWTEIMNLLVNKPGSYLFHCTQGKDRTGIAAALILAALGVDDQTIRDDYLQTNLYMDRQTPVMLERAQKYLPKHIHIDIEQFLVAAPVYFDTMMQTAEPYGGLLGYLQGPIGLTDDDIATLRKTYLE